MGSHPPQDPPWNHSESLTSALRDAYREALLLGSAEAAERIVAEAIDAGLPELLIDEQIITPAMRVVGDRWAAGDISVADEHLATSISFRIMALQRERFRVTAERASTRIVLAAVEGERHVLGLEMAASALVHAGYDVRMLGADVPSQDIGPAVGRHDPSVVGLTMSSHAAASAAHDAIDAAREVRPSVGLLLGGRAASAIRPPDRAVAICTHVSDVLELTDALVQRASLN